MYEVATSLCHLLFATYKVHDALLFTTILTMDLRALRRRGYNGDYNVPPLFDPANSISVVDRILKQQQKAEREAVAEALAKKADKTTPALPSKSEIQPVPTPTPKISHEGPQVPEKSITDLVTPLTNIGGSPPQPLGLTN